MKKILVIMAVAGLAMMASCSSGSGNSSADDSESALPVLAPMMDPISPAAGAVMRAVADSSGTKKTEPAAATKDSSHAATAPQPDSSGNKE